MGRNRIHVEVLLSGYSHSTNPIIWGCIFYVFTDKLFANLLMFHLLFLAAQFLSIKIVSQKAEKCNRTFTTIRNVSLMAVYLNKFRFDYFFLVDRQFPNTVMKKKRLYRMVAPIL